MSDSPYADLLQVRVREIPERDTGDVLVWTTTNTTDVNQHHSHGGQTGVHLNDRILAN